MSKPTTANDAYHQRAENCRALLRALEAKIEAHAMRQATDRRNWGYPGDLAHVEELLQQAHDFLGGTPEVRTED